jgi:NADH:ubiquinone oxidoreductase subunit F (NADH-binding)/NADH:ubiquinone oxidoreductase subunit E/Pyruvate/2-oxoacid:ferredoxin oxidoreductase delta subunit
MSAVDLSFVDQTVERLGPRPDAAIPILQALQQHYRYLPHEALERVCKLTQITPAEIAGVASFYTQFRHHPVGKHIISVCHGTACHVKGAGLVQDALQRQLHIANGNDTDPDGLFTIEKVACLGCCTLAPVIQIDGVTYGRLHPTQIADVLRDFLDQRHAAAKPPPPAAAPPRGPVGEIRVGLGSCCQAQGSAKVHEAIQQVLGQTGAAAVVKRVGCVGMCHQTPLVEIVAPGGRPQLFSKVQAEDVPAIVLEHFRPQGALRRVRHAAARWLDRLQSDEVPSPLVRQAIDVRDPPVCAFLGPQLHLATEACGQIDPIDLDEYLRHDGFVALRRCLSELTPEQIIAEVQQSGLRGRGGAGFPTGVKWSKVRAAAGVPKYIICNGDEGDPGAFMDRMLLESFPYRIIEGMAIAARAVGAAEGIFYIRAEYPLAVQRIGEALRRCQQHGFLGEKLFGSDFSLRLRVQEGAGAFVCGEETALLASIEGRRGMPRLRPPFPAECGLWGKPTLVNNVETYALTPWIFRHGAAKFAALGTEKSKGTKVFALAGKVRRGGLIEVPMGVTIRQIVEQIGGGAAGGRRFKAVQVGGPSGGCVPAELADTPVDFEALTAVGAIMGSGGLVVLDDADCMVDIARYFLRFTQDQSCGKCTFCRIGTRRMLDVLDRICAGAGKAGDLEELEDLARMVGAGSICGLGRTAPNPVLSTLKYFRHEYEAHLAGRCPAGKCEKLVHYRITEKCIGCTLCAQQCPVDAIPLTPYARHQVLDDRCTRCDACRQVCPVEAVEVV